MTVAIQNHAKFYLCFTKINLNFFSGAPKLPLIPKYLLHLKLKNHF